MDSRAIVDIVLIALIFYEIYATLTLKTKRLKTFATQYTNESLKSYAKTEAIVYLICAIFILMITLDEMKVLQIGILPFFSTTISTVFVVGCAALMFGLWFYGHRVILKPLSGNSTSTNGRKRHKKEEEEDF